MKPLVPLPDLAPQTDPAMERYTGAFEALEGRLQTTEPSWLGALRKAGLAHFAAAGLPTQSDEDWRYTNLTALRELAFEPTLGRPAPELAGEALDGMALGDLNGDRLVFVDGHFSPALSQIHDHGEDLTVAPLSSLLGEQSSVLQSQLGKHLNLQASPFVALNQAFFSDGVFIGLAANCHLPDPVHLVFVSTARKNGTSVHLRNLLLAERGSQATVIEHYLSLGEAATLTNAVTEIVAGENASLEHLRYQEESAAAFHFGFTRLIQAASSRVSAHCISTGARLFRHHYDPCLDGEGAECVLNGLYLVKGRQLADHHMVVEHARAHCDSHEYFNGILADQARGVFHGRILVRPGAQKTDAKQTNKNILLSNEARANTKPQLEIYADDVKCTHGATIGQLDPEAIFYLRARGIPEETARRMLVHSFAGEITDRIQHAPLREEMHQLVWDWLETLDAVRVGGRDASEEPAIAG